MIYNKRSMHKNKDKMVLNLNNKLITKMLLNNIKILQIEYNKLI